MANDNNRPNIPWYNMFPHSEYSIRNIDWFIKSWGEYSYRISQLEESDKTQNITIADHETRIADLESFEADITPRVETLENNVSGLQDAVSQIDNSLTDLENDVEDLESEVSDIDTRLGQTENTVRNIDVRVDYCEEAISDLQSDGTSMSNRIQANTNDITALDSRIDSLESHSVIANAGGATSAVLSTLSVDGTNYEVPQGGGGGGSTVIPNASGTPTADLTSLGVDGYVYAIPTGVDTSDLIAEEYEPTATYNTGDAVIYNGNLYTCNEDNVTGAWDGTKWTMTTCTDIANNAKDTAENIEALYSALGSFYEDTASGEDDTSSSTRSYLPGTRRTLTPGSWLITYNASFDTHELGSKQRGLYTYLKAGNDTIAQGGKYMWGSEAITDINYTNSVSISALVNVPSGSTLQITPEYRVPVNTGSGSYEVSVRVSYVCIKPIT